MMMNETDLLKETLHAQQGLLQKLYNELDAERESSATAADETLSMILRIQGEKAAMEMEASQYKRIAEEKMFYAQETVEIFQELIYQKELQIASLEFQVQAYKFKLASLGFNDVTSSDMNYPENMLSRRASTEGTRATTPSPKKLLENEEGTTLRRASTTGDVSSYREEINKLDERVKGFAKLECSTISVHDPSPDTCLDELDLHECPEKVVKVEICGESLGSTSVLDIFEVPQCPQNKEKPELSLDRENGNGKLDTVWDPEEQLFLSQESDRSSPDPNEVEEKIDGKIEKQKLLKHPTYGVVDFELEELNRRLEQLESARFFTRDREINFETGDGGLKILKEMMEKVEAVQSEIMSLRTKKPPPPEDPSFGCFKEVLFSLLPFRSLFIKPVS